MAIVTISPMRCATFWAAGLAEACGMPGRLGVLEPAGENTRRRDLALPCARRACCSRSAICDSTMAAACGAALEITCSSAYPRAADRARAICRMTAVLLAL